MPGRKSRPWTLTILALLLAPPAPLSAQNMPGTVPGMGSVSPQTGQLNNAMPGQAQAPATSAPDSETGVSFIDSALPMSQVRLLIDGNYDFRRPGRAEYLFPKSGAPGDPGWWRPERRVDWYELTSYFEVAIQSQFSLFGAIATRFVYPDINSDDWGLDDLDIGCKWAFFSCPGLTTTLQVRGTIPTRDGPGLGSSHFSVEPALLLNFRPMQWLAVEGEVRYWLPITNVDFAGDMVRYGLGLTIGERSYDDFWFTPVIEMVGWTLLGGKELIYFPPDTGIARSASGETIANAMGGVRFGFGDTGDIYLGYGHAVTGDAWQHWLWRVEFRVRF
jgi:hypothetical protein